jgi:hypothetical protein
VKRILAAIAIVVLAACSGNFSSGTSMPQQNGLPPMGNTTPMPQTDKNGLPIESAGPSASPETGAGNGTYPIDQAQNGFACPQMTDGYACTLSFNLPAPTPAPSPSGKSAKGKAKATATPSPTPSPTPTPVPSPSASADASASPSPSPTPATVTLLAEALPKNAPKMVHTPANTLDVVPLIMVQLTTNGDFPVDGWVNAQFTLPKAQIDGRGFAVQLFQAAKHKKGVDYRPIWTFDKSVLNDTTLTFSFKSPKMTIAKGSTYTLVLYGDDKSNVRSGSASPSASPSASSSPSAAPSLTPAPSPTP